MSDTYKVQVDIKKVNALLTQLNDAQSKRAIKAGLRRSVAIIRRQAQANLASVVPNSKTLKKEINQTIYRTASVARIDLIDKRKKGSNQFTLKFFELGTKTRTNVKGGATGANRGRIPAYHFLKRAEEAKKGEAEKALEGNILQSINRVIQKNK